MAVGGKKRRKKMFNILNLKEIPMNKIFINTSYLRIEEKKISANVSSRVGVEGTFKEVFIILLSMFVGQDHAFFCLICSCLLLCLLIC